MLCSNGDQGGLSNEGQSEHILHEVRERHAGFLGNGFPGRANGRHKGLESGTTTLVFKGPQTAAVLSKESSAKGAREMLLAELS